MLDQPGLAHLTTWGRRVSPFVNYSLPNLLVENHPDQQCEGVLRQEGVGLRVAGKIELKLLVRHMARLLRGSCLLYGPASIPCCMVPSRWAGLEAGPPRNKDRVVHVFLETDRLLLRRFTTADVEHLFELNSDPDVMRLINGGKPTPQALAIIEAFKHADLKGLDPEDYDASRWDTRLATTC